MESLVIKVIVLLLLLIGSPVYPAALTRPPVSQLAWESCDLPFEIPATPAADASAPPPLSGLECASVSVPLDYANPGGDQITVAFNRLPARDAPNRIGPLIVNPGGPGGSGMELVLGAALGLPLFGDDIRDRFDIIGMDPRGVGASTPVKCDPDLYNQPVSLFPENEAEYEALLAYNRALGESCLAMTGPLLGHIDTVSAARDIEAVRLALGGEKLNFLGLSYGSMLGAQYAALYPEQIRVMALDGALEHSLSEITMLVDEATAYEEGFNRFVAWCAEDTACALHGQDAGALFDDLVAQAEETPLPAPACADGTAPQPCQATVRAEDLRLNTQEMLLSPEPQPEFGIPGWNGLAQALAEAAAGDASAFSRKLVSGPTDNMLLAGPAIACLDFPAGSQDYDDVAALHVLGRAIAPHMHGAGQSWTIVTKCLGWPVPLVNPPHPANVRGAPPILIVNSTHDPSTAYPWAHGLLRQIEDSVLLTRLGDGHTSYLRPGPSRTRAAIDKYLLTGETPPPNTVYED
jgi:pimeloyl-ACP methyl ester carboxylesterase